MSRRWLISVYALVIGSSLLRAELVWENPTLIINSRSGETSAVGVFRFINRGTHPVRIVRVAPSCGCTVAKPSEDLVPAGGGGELPATVSLSPRDSMRAVTIKVGTDEGPDVHYNLALQVSIIEPVQVTPRLLYWKRGDAPAAKSIVLKLEDGAEVTHVAVQGDGFTAELDSPSEKELFVRVTPTDTARPGTAHLRLTVKQNGRETAAPNAILRVME